MRKRWASAQTQPWFCACTSNSALTDPTAPCPHHLSEFDPVSEEELLKIIQSSKNATCELDPLPTELLKNTLPVHLSSLIKLFNLSLSSGVVPASFKHAIVKPLIKKSSLDAENPKNYRPISNLSFLSKILERIVSKRLSNYMSNHGLH